MSDRLEPIRRVFRSAGLYHHAADDLLCGELADAAAPPAAARGEAVAWRVWRGDSYELFFNEDAAKRRCQCFVQQRSPEPLYAAPPAAPRDESPIDIGGECVPRWIVEYANKLTTYFAERGGKSWAIGGVQSREQAPPAAMAVPRLIAALEALADYVDERVGDSECRPLENARAAIAAALAEPAANVTPMRQPRADLARLVESINAAVYANGDGLSVTEAIGALELAKLELLKEQEQ